MTPGVGFPGHTRRQALTAAVAAAASPASALDRGAGHISLMEPGAISELRGLSLVPGAYWASGSKGVLYRGGSHRALEVIRPAGETLDFRGLHAFNANHVLAMSVGPGEASQLWRTRDAGRTWTVELINTDPEGFWDALVFADDRRTGFILGDPTQGRFTLLITLDGGATWARASDSAIPLAAPGEAAFAASNGCLALGPRGQVAFCTGGAGRGRVYLSRDGAGRLFQVFDTPIAADGPTRGAFALAFGRSGELWVCGGDYQKPGAVGANLALLQPGENRFTTVGAPPGFLSSIAVGDVAVLATGLAGTIVGHDGGAFERITAMPFNVARLSDRRSGVLAGPRGSIGFWSL
jgi:photosystem II stability/assembly factor-like uncharacterized protein